MCKFIIVVLTNLFWWSNRFKSESLFIKDFWVQRKRNSCSFKSFYGNIFLFSVANISLCCICSSVISALAILNKNVFYLCLNLYTVLQLNRFLTIYTPCHICVHISLFLRERFIVEHAYSYIIQRELLKINQYFIYVSIFVLPLNFVANNSQRFWDKRNICLLPGHNEEEEQTVTL